MQATQQLIQLIQPSGLRLMAERTISPNATTQQIGTAIGTGGTHSSSTIASSSLTTASGSVSIRDFFRGITTLTTPTITTRTTTIPAITPTSSRTIIMRASTARRQ